MIPAGTFNLTKKKRIGNGSDNRDDRHSSNKFYPIKKSDFGKINTWIAAVIQPAVADRIVLKMANSYYGELNFFSLIKLSD